MLKKSNFINPGPEFRGKPFWSWNGELESKELLRQIEIFKDMGMGGYFCHSRTGLETEYLGDEWFSLINDCSDHGTKLSMETWLYDEDRWPSGTAGGLVTDDPKYKLKFIRVTRIDADKFADFTLPENTLAVFFADMDGLHFKNVVRADENSAVKGNTALIFSVELMKNSSFYNGESYVDTMSLEATNRFLEITHEKYKKHCGDRFGDGIKGIFTDEPHRGALMNGFGVSNENAKNLSPYTDDLFEEFKNRYGYDLMDKLPEVFYFPEGTDFSQVKYHYVELLQELFLERFIIPIREWCNKENLKLTGHVLHEDSLTAQVCMQGSLMRSYEFMDVPGMDLLTSRNKRYWIAKQVASVARQQGKPWILSELYGNTGWHLTFEDHKLIGDWQALFGVNLRCHHLSWYTMKGEAKRDYPASVFYQSYWYRYYRYVEEYYARIHYFQQQGNPVCDVLVVNPLESLWGSVYPGWASNALQSVEPYVTKLEKIYEKTFMALSGEQVDFDYGDEDHIARHGSVKDGRFVIGKSSYSTVILPAMKTVRSTTLRLLAQFRKAGGQVIFVENYPTYIDAVFCGDKIETEFSGDAVKDTRAMVKKLACDSPISVLGKDGKKNKNIFLQARQGENCVQYMLLNIDAKNEYTLTLGKRPYNYLEKWDARTGEVTLLTNSATEDVTVTISAGGEIMLVATADDNKYPLETDLAFTNEHILPKESEFKFKLSEPNVCVLDRASFKLEDGTYGREKEILRVDKQLREHFGINLRTGEMCQPWYTKLFGTKEAQISGNGVTLEYSFFADYVPKSVTLAIETPEQFEVMINGKAIGSKIDCEYWVDPCFKQFEIPENAIIKGKNIVTLKTKVTPNSNFEALYLLGEFGVNVKEGTVTITKLPKTLKIGDISKQGLPFYGAGLSYTVCCPEVANGEKLFLDLSDSHAACYVLRDKNGKEQIVGFPPFKCDVTEFAGKEIEIEYAFTRRNTFGPLHRKSLRSWYCGPFSFRTSGASYLKNAYSLIEQGMLKPIKFCSYK